MKGAVRLDRSSFDMTGLSALLQGKTDHVDMAHVNDNWSRMLTVKCTLARGDPGAAVPVNGRAQTGWKVGGGVPAERGLCSRGVEPATRLPVGLRRVEADLAFETG